MTRKLTDTLKSEIDTVFPDNTEGLITPQALREVVKDVIDSLRPAYAALIADHTAAPLEIDLTSSWQVLAGATIWNVGKAESDPLELSASVTGGLITPIYIGYNHWVSAAAHFTGQTGREYQFALAIGGAAGNAPLTVDGQGLTRIVNVYGQTIKIPQSGQSFSLLARAPEGNSTIELHVARFIVELGTTRFI